MRAMEARFFDIFELLELFRFERKYGEFSMHRSSLFAVLLLALTVSSTCRGQCDVENTPTIVR